MVWKTRAGSIRNMESSLWFIKTNTWTNITNLGENNIPGINSAQIKSLLIWYHISLPLNPKIQVNSWVRTYNRKSSYHHKGKKGKWFQSSDYQKVLKEAKERVPNSSNSMTNGCTPSLLNKALTSEEYLEKKEKKRIKLLNISNKLKKTQIMERT